MWQKCEAQGITYYTLPSWREAGAEVVMTTREGGVSRTPYDRLNLGLHVGDDPAAVVENRCGLLAATNMGGENFVSLQQVHGQEIFHAREPDRGRGFYSYDDAPVADGIFTAGRQLVMATFYADCLPIAVFHPGKQLLGLAHAGWKGTYQNIVAALIAAMREYRDFDPTELWAALGAGIGPCCYEVDHPFYERFGERYDEAPAWFLPAEGGKYHFNNEQANVDLLKQAGLREENISPLGLCTACHDDLFFSYRKSGGRCGRHGLLAALI